MATVQRSTLCLAGVNFPRLVQFKFTVKTYLCYPVAIIIMSLPFNDVRLYFEIIFTFLSTGNSRGRTLPPVTIFAGVEEMGKEGKHSITLRGPR